jgi:hypothetical protein
MVAGFPNEVWAPSQVTDEFTSWIRQSPAFTPTSLKPD